MDSWRDGSGPPSEETEEGQVDGQPKGSENVAKGAGPDNSPRKRARLKSDTTHGSTLADSNAPSIPPNEPFIKPGEAKEDPDKPFGGNGAGEHAGVDVGQSSAAPFETQTMSVSSPLIEQFVQGGLERSSFVDSAQAALAAAVQDSSRRSRTQEFDQTVSSPMIQQYLDNDGEVVFGADSISNELALPLEGIRTSSEQYAGDFNRPDEQPESREQVEDQRGEGEPAAIAGDDSAMLEFVQRAEAQVAEALRHELQRRDQLQQGLQLALALHQRQQANTQQQPFAPHGRPVSAAVTDVLRRHLQPVAHPVAIAAARLDEQAVRRSQQETEDLASLVLRLQQIRELEQQRQQTDRLAHQPNDLLAMARQRQHLQELLGPDLSTGIPPHVGAGGSILGTTDARFRSTAQQLPQGGVSGPSFPTRPVVSRQRQQDQLLSRAGAAAQLPQVPTQGTQIAPSDHQSGPSQIRTLPATSPRRAEERKRDNGDVERSPSSRGN